MSKEQVRDTILSLWTFAASSLAFLFNFLTNQETWITFATAATGFLSIAKALHIFWTMRRSRKEQDTTKAVIDFANKVIDITEASRKAEPKPPPGIKRRDKS